MTTKQITKRIAKAQRALDLAQARLASASGDHNRARELFARQGISYAPAFEANN